MLVSLKNIVLGNSPVPWPLYKDSQMYTSYLSLLWNFNIHHRINKSPQLGLLCKFTSIQNKLMHMKQRATSSKILRNRNIHLTQAFFTDAVLLMHFCIISYGQNGRVASYKREFSHHQNTKSHYAERRERNWIVDCKCEANLTRVPSTETRSFPVSETQTKDKNTAKFATSTSLSYDLPFQHYHL